MIGNLPIDRFASVDGSRESIKRFLGQILLHGPSVEHMFTEIFGHFLFRSDCFYSLSVESLLHSIEA